MPSRTDMSDQDGSLDIGIREADGGWIIKFARSFTDEGVIIGEKICTSDEEVIGWLRIELPVIKTYWNLRMLETDGETTMRDYNKKVRDKTETDILKGSRRRK